MAIGGLRDGAVRDSLEAAARRSSIPVEERIEILRTCMRFNYEMEELGSSSQLSEQPEQTTVCQKLRAES